MKDKNRRRLCRAMIGLMAMILPMPALAGEIPELMEPVGVKMATAEVVTQDICKLEMHEGNVATPLEGLAFSVSGSIEGVYVTVGQSVKAGDVLLTLRQDDLNDSIEQLSREIDRSRQEGRYADEIGAIDREMMALALEKLILEGADSTEIEKKQLDIEAFDLEQALSRDLRALEISQMEESLKSLQAQADQNVLTAPMDGTVVYLADLESGSVVNAYNEIIYLADDSILRVETDYMLQSILDQADRIYAYVGGGVYDLVLMPQNEQDFYARILAGETVNTCFEVLNPDDQITAGAYAMVCIESESVLDALVIPRNTLYMEGGRRYVYMVSDGVRHRREIEIGLLTDTLVEVKAGLEAGEMVYVQE